MAQRNYFLWPEQKESEETKSVWLELLVKNVFWFLSFCLGLFIAHMGWI